MTEAGYEVRVPEQAGADPKVEGGGVVADLVQAPEVNVFARTVGKKQLIN